MSLPDVAFARPSTPQVLTGLPVMRAVDGHYTPAPFYLGKDDFGGMPIQLAGGDISDKVGKPVADPHRHDVPELYFLVSPTPGGARIDVQIDGEHHEVSSPAIVYVPAGAQHRFLTLAAEKGSYCFGIFLEDQA